jgi:hypothetical protein
MQPVMVMFIGTWADIRPMRIIFSPVSGWNAESYNCLARQILSSVSPGMSTPILQAEIKEPLSTHTIYLTQRGAHACIDTLYTHGKMMVLQAFLLGIEHE